MPDIFDQVAPDPVSPAAPDIFDRVTASAPAAAPAAPAAPDIFDRVTAATIPNPFTAAGPTTAIPQNDPGWAAAQSAAGGVALRRQTDPSRQMGLSAPVQGPIPPGGATLTQGPQSLGQDIANAPFRSRDLMAEGLWRTGQHLGQTISTVGQMLPGENNPVTRFGDYLDAQNRAKAEAAAGMVHEAPISNPVLSAGVNTVAPLVPDIGMALMFPEQSTALFAGKGALGGIGQAAEEVKAAREAGKDIGGGAELARKAGYAATGALANVVPARIVGQAMHGAGNIATRLIRGVGENAVVSAADQTARNMIAQATGDPNRQTLAGTGTALTEGAKAGAVFAGAGEVGRAFTPREMGTTVPPEAVPPAEKPPTPQSPAPEAPIPQRPPEAPIAPQRANGAGETPVQRDVFDAAEARMRMESQVRGAGEAPAAPVPEAEAPPVEVPKPGRKPAERAARAELLRQDNAALADLQSHRLPASEYIGRALDERQQLLDEATSQYEATNGDIGSVWDYQRRIDRIDRSLRDFGYDFRANPLPSAREHVVSETMRSGLREAAESRRGTAVENDAPIPDAEAPAPTPVQATRKAPSKLPPGDYIPAEAMGRDATPTPDTTPPKAEGTDAAPAPDTPTQPPVTTPAEGAYARKTAKLDDAARAKLNADIEQAGNATEAAFRAMNKADAARGSRSSKSWDKKNRAYEKAQQAWNDASARERELKAQLRDSSLEDIAERPQDDAARFFARTRLNRDALFDFDGVTHRPKSDEGKAAYARARELVDPFVDKKIANRDDVLDEATRVALSLDPSSYAKSADDSLRWASQVAEWPTRQKAILDELEKLDYTEKPRDRRKIYDMRNASDLPMAQQILDDAKATAASEKAMADRLEREHQEARVARVSELSQEPLKPSIKHLEGNLVADKESPLVSDGRYLIDTAGMKPNGLLSKMRAKPSARDLPDKGVRQYLNDKVKAAASNPVLDDHGYRTVDDRTVRYFSDENGNDYAVNADILATVEKAIGGYDGLRASGGRKDALVIYKDGKPIGLISPINLDARQEIDIPRARKALSGKPAEESSPDVPDVEEGGGKLESPGMPAMGYNKGRPALADPAPWHDGTRVSAPEVIESFGDALTKGISPDSIVPFRVGHIKGTARGHYEVGPDLIRLRKANNLSTASHELFHAIEDALFNWSRGGPWKNPLVSSTMQREMADLGKALYGNRTPNGGYKREGFAEYGRLFLMGEDAYLKQAMPNFDTWFRNDFLPLHPKLKEQLDIAGQKMRTWYDQGAENRAVASIAKRPGTNLRIPDRTAIKAALIDQFAYLEKFANEAARKAGRPLKVSEDPYLSASAMRMTHSAILEQWVEHGMTDFAGNRIGPSLQDAIGLVGDKRNEFGQYLWARRTLKMATKNRDSGMSVEDAQHLFQKHHSPEFEMAAQKFYDWFDGVLDYVGQSSPSFKRVVDAIKQGDVGDYLPLMREFADDNGAASTRAPGGVLGASPAKRQKGSGRRVLDPFEETLRKADQWIRAAQQRYVLDQVHKLATNVGGLGHWMAEIPKDQVPTKINAEQALKSMVDEGLIDPADLAAAGIDPKALADEMVTVFTPAMRPYKKDDVPVAAFYDKGQTKWYQFDPKLYQSLAGLDSVNVHKVIDWLLVKPASLFRTGTTGLSAGFSLYTNPARDLPTFLLQTHSKGTPKELLRSWASGMKEAATAAVTGKSGEWVDLFNRLGLEMAQPLGQDVFTTRREVRRLFESKKMRVLDVRNAYDQLRAILQFSDAGPRIAELQRMAKDVGWTPGTPMSVDQAMAMRLAARRVTVDFAAGGWLTKVWNRITPYHGAQIQGLRTFARTFKRDPLRATLYGLATLTAPTVAAWLRNKDEDWYNDLPDDQRYRYWYVRNGNNVLRIPRPFDWAMPFSILPESILHSLYKQDPDAALQAARVMAQNLVPPLMPTTLNVAGEQLTGRQDIIGKPFESMGEQFKPPAERFGPQTSVPAKVIGGAIGYSPKKIDALIQGTMGAVGGDVAKVMNPSLAGEGDLSGVPVAGRLFRSGGAMGTPSSSKVIDQFYRELAQRRERAASSEAEDNQDRDRRLDLEDTSETLKGLREQYNKAADNEQRQAIKREMMAVAKDALARTPRYHKPATGGKKKRQ